MANPRLSACVYACSSCASGQGSENQPLKWMRCSCRHVQYAMDTQLTAKGFSPLFYHFETFPKYPPALCDVTRAKEVVSLTHSAWEAGRGLQAQVPLERRNIQSVREHTKMRAISPSTCSLPFLKKKEAGSCSGRTWNAPTKRTEKKKKELNPAAALVGSAASAPTHATRQQT